MNNIVDLKTIDKLKKIQLKKKRVKPPKWTKNLKGLIVRISWYNNNDEIVEIEYDPNNPFMSLTKDGKIMSIEFLQDIICCICDEPDIAAEYTEFLEKAYKYLKEIK